MPSEVQEGKCKRLKQCITKLMKKLFIMLTFGWYIRYIFETNQYVLISCVYEVFMFNTFDSAHIISLCFAILLCFSCCILIIFVLCLSLSSYEVSEKVHCKLGEVFSGVKMNKKCKFYVSVLLIRRALYVVLLITLNSIQSWLLISILSIIQLWYLVFIIFLRPFANKKDNIIEISNEIFFCALLSSLIFLNTESDWNPAITDIYMWTIALNSMFIFSIMMIDFIRCAVLFIKKCCIKSEVRNQIVDFKANNQISSMIPASDLTIQNISKIQNKINQEKADPRNDRYRDEESKIIIEESKFNKNQFEV